MGRFSCFTLQINNKILPSTFRLMKWEDLVVYFLEINIKILPFFIMWQLNPPIFVSPKRRVEGGLFEGGVKVSSEFERGSVGDESGFEVGVWWRG